jgi:hypothetical protein
VFGRRAQARQSRPRSVVLLGTGKPPMRILLGIEQELRNPLMGITEACGVRGIVPKGLRPCRRKAPGQTAAAPTLEVSASPFASIADRHRPPHRAKGHGAAGGAAVGCEGTPRAVEWAVSIERRKSRWVSSEKAGFHCLVAVARQALRTE